MKNILYLFIFLLGGVCGSFFVKCNKDDIGCDKFVVDPDRYDMAHKSFFKFQSIYYMYLLGGEIVVDDKISEKNKEKFISFLEGYEKNMDNFLRDKNDKAVLMYLKSLRKNIVNIDNKFAEKIGKLENNIGGRGVDIIKGNHEKEPFYRDSSLLFIEKLYNLYKNSSSNEDQIKWGNFFAEYAFIYYLLIKAEIIPEDILYTKEVRKIARPFIRMRKESLYQSLSDPLHVKTLGNEKKAALPIGYEGVNQRKYEQLVKEFKNWINE